MHTHHKNPLLNVVFVLTPNMLATSMTLPTELLLAAQSLGRTQLPKGTSPTLNILCVSEDGLAVKTHTGIKLMPDKAIRDVASADILYLPALWRNPQTVIKQSPNICQKLKAFYKAGANIAAVGTGCCFIADSGLLDNKPATTHWYYFDQFSKRYPNVHLKKNVFITQANTLYCTGSVNALAELTVTFISDYFSHIIAKSVQRHFFHEVRDNLTHHAQRFNEVTYHNDEHIMQVQAWLNDNISEVLTLEVIATHFNVSKRTLSRRFKQATGTTVNQYIQTVRIDMAKELIQKTNLTLAEIIERIGYQDVTYFNQLFKKIIGSEPQEYKNTVRGKVFDIDPSRPPAQ